MSTVERSPADSNPSYSNPLFDSFTKLAIANVISGYHANHDLLTGLLNKGAVKAQAQERILSGEPFGLLLMDWDAFKTLNDTLGHEKADQMLEEFGPYMNQHFRREGDALAHEKSIRQSQTEDEYSDCVLGRYGGDEFLGLVNLGDREKPDGLTPTERMGKAETYLRSIATGFVDLQEQAVKDLKFNISIGSAVWEPHGSRQVSDLLKIADTAMYADKRAHGAPAR